MLRHSRLTAINRNIASARTTLLLETDFFIILFRKYYMKTARTSLRKQQHMDINLTKEVSFCKKTAGFEHWDFLHNALPELNLSDVDPSTSFLGKKIAFPFIISSMTGGYANAMKINRQLAEVCAEKRIAMGVGSQRQALEDDRFHRSFSVVREVADNIPIFGNIGAAEVTKLRDASPILRLIELVQADGFAVHLNPMQELLQPEGNTNFRGVLAGIEMLVKAIPVPLIVKEIGAGISADVAQRLVDSGVTIIDVAGAGGTSWAGVEILRRKRKNEKIKKEAVKLDLNEFWDWGIPTVDALRGVCKLKSKLSRLKVISSGGISNGIHIAKSLAFGADYVAVARPVLKTLVNGGVKSVLRLIDQWECELKGVMFLTGSQCIASLQTQQMIPSA
jgi:isopentenyl-diphosphate Delta-isomerase